MAIEQDLVEAVSLVKEANELIVQLQQENDNLRKQASSAPAVPDTQADGDKVREVVEKMANVIVAGRPLIPALDIGHIINSFDLAFDQTKKSGISRFRYFNGYREYTTLTIN